MPKILIGINSLGLQVQESNMRDSNMKDRIAKQIRIINEKLQPKQKELTILIDEIYDLEGRVAKRLSVTKNTFK